MRAFLLLITAVTCNSANLESLNGQWLLKDTTGEFNNIPATVPGGIYSDLMTHGTIGDIFHGYNDIETKWVPRRNWTYYRNFTVGAELIGNENVNLVLEGLDTFARVLVNNEEVGRSRNMFVRYMFDVKKQLKVGVNYLEIQFRSPIEVGAELAQIQAKNYVVPPTCPPDEYRGECNVNMLRKMQASYSWDWGPSFPSVGIWKDIYIEAYSESVIRYLVADVRDNNDSWVLNADIYFANNERNQVSGRVHLNIKLDSRNIDTDINVSTGPNQFGEFVQSTSLTIPKSDVATWWPNGYGGQPLYNMTATFSSNNGDEHSKEIRVGFRTIELVQDQLNNGLSFYFKVNGVPIFMKGTNEIPLDILPERGQNKRLIRILLNTARHSHMNMIRIWGGGVYESDYFYDIADEYGILIWQDFMFACAMYPTYDSYLENVIEEVRHQVNRLRSHPSIALFAGNNENEGALRQNWYGTGSNFTLYYNDYVKLYINTIQNEFERLTHNRSIFLSSSPSNGKQSINEGYVAQNPGDYNYGDVHFYNYELNPWDSTIYPVSRFSSEYGYQSLPSEDSLKSAITNEKDLIIGSDFLDHRQHHPGGNEQMKSLIEFNLRLPVETHRNYTRAFIYYLQIAQAMGIKIETEHYRRYRSSVNNYGQGYTMGALYWQLNDVWLAPSWSGIDFAGKWKMLQYFVREFFAPIIVTGHIDTQRNLDVYIVSDILVPLPNLTASIKVYKWNSFTPVYTQNLPVTVEAAQSNHIQTIEIDKLLSEQNCGTTEMAKYNCFVHLSVNNGRFDVVPNNYVFPSPLKNSSALPANVKIESVTKVDEHLFNITLTTDNIALFVWLNTKFEGHFSENGFLLEEPTKTIYYTSENNIRADRFYNSLSITNLLDEVYFN